ncbi:MAG: hypothetical protein AB6733_19965 [Clostridiaceae bacterium]
MKKEFVKKMLKAELLRYEAIKEILPENIKSSISKIEKDAAEVIKDLAIEFLKEQSDVKEEVKKEVKKVKVDFN